MYKDRYNYNTIINHSTLERLLASKKKTTHHIYYTIMVMKYHTDIATELTTLEMLKKRRKGQVDAICRPSFSLWFAASHL